MSRYVTFFKSLQESSSTEVSFLAQIVKEDAHSTTSMNLCYIQDETGLDPLTTTAVLIKRNEKKADIPEGQTWRLSTLDFLLTERKQREDRLEKTDKISIIIYALCST